MLFRVCGGLFLLLTGLAVFGLTISTPILGVLALLAGIGLLAGY